MGCAGDPVRGVGARARARGRAGLLTSARESRVPGRGPEGAPARAPPALARGPMEPRLVHLERQQEVDLEVPEDGLPERVAVVVVTPPSPPAGLGPTLPSPPDPAPAPHDPAPFGFGLPLYAWPGP